MEKQINIDNVIDLKYLYFDYDNMPKELKAEYDEMENTITEWISNYSISIVNKTNYYAEHYIVNKKLKKRIFDKDAFAWKAGKVTWNNNMLCCQNEERGGYLNGMNNRVDKNEFSNYIEQLETKKADIESGLQGEKWEEIYDVMKADAPKNFGPVNILNALFFISGGKAPIYDQFVHKAVRALASDIYPGDVYLGNNPDKNETQKVIIMYKEYMLLLRKLFPSKCCKNGVFIPRDLDRALWVYGHAQRKNEEMLID